MSDHIHGFDHNLGRACDTVGAPCENRAKRCGAQMPNQESSLNTVSCGKFHKHSGQHEGWGKGMKLVGWSA
ncbi:hypothetical protein C1M55_11965 [Rhodococcus qingshengii]|nr:hypothetical protein C1M55_11965 [Rhodococcus qingshengii]